GALEPLIFLSLPREVRDRIYELILDFEVEPSEAPDEDAERGTVHPKFSNILAPQQLPPTSTANLLRCNRQIFHELSQTISRCDITYKLVLMLKGMKEDRSHATVGICPTWTKLPASLRHLKYVDVNIRFCNQAVLWSPGVTCMPTALSLLHLLGCAFAYGPKFAETFGPCEPFFVQEMRVNVDEEYSDKFSIWYSSNRQTIFTRLPDYLAQIARRGVLSRKVRAISFYWRREFRDRWDIEASIKPDCAARSRRVQTVDPVIGDGSHSESISDGILCLVILVVMLPLGGTGEGIIYVIE
ncbi:MAG: hypothetical protein L6R42_007797, partial [Xanthoria sp. 1 TBL-2021]